MIGLVTAEAGSVVQDVNISLKGTNRGTTTHSQQVYSIVTESGSVLAFSFIGFPTREMIVGSLTKINISLKNEVSRPQKVVITA